MEEITDDLEQARIDAVYDVTRELKGERPQASGA